MFSIRSKEKKLSISLSDIHCIKKISERHLFLIGQLAYCTHKAGIDAQILFPEELLQSNAKCVTEVRQCFNSRIAQTKLYLAKVALRHPCQISKLVSGKPALFSQICYS